MSIFCFINFSVLLVTSSKVIFLPGVSGKYFFDVRFVDFGSSMS